MKKLIEITSDHEQYGFAMMKEGQQTMKRVRKMCITKQELERCASLAREADNLRERMIRLRAAAEGAGMRLDGVPGGGVGDPVGEAVANLDKLRARWMRAIDQYLALMLRADEAIAGLDSPEVRTVLRLRYIDGLPWEEVSVKVNYASSHCRRLCSKGLRELSGELEGDADEKLA